MDPDKWIEKALEHAPRVICHLPRNFSHHGEHIDMGWDSWAHFEKVFAAFDFKRIDIIEGAKFDTNLDADLLYPKGIGQFAHPIVEFGIKGQNYASIKTKAIKSESSAKSGNKKTKKDKKG